MRVKGFFSRIYRAVRYSALICWCYEDQKLIVLELKKTNYLPTATIQNVRFNCHEDLKKFDECESWHNKEAMLKIFDERLAKEEVVATLVEGDYLTCYAWLAPSQSKAYFPLVRQQFEFPNNHAAIYNVYTHNNYRGRGFYKGVLNALVEWVFTSTAHDGIVTAIEHDNKVAMKVNRAMGFKPIACLTYRRRFGRVITGCVSV